MVRILLLILETKNLPYLSDLIEDQLNQSLTNKILYLGLFFKFLGSQGGDTGGSFVHVDLLATQVADS